MAIFDYIICAMVSSSGVLQDRHTWHAGYSVLLWYAIQEIIVSMRFEYMIMNESLDI